MGAVPGNTVVCVPGRVMPEVEEVVEEAEGGLGMGGERVASATAASPVGDRDAAASDAGREPEEGFVPTTTPPGPLRLPAAVAL